MDLNSVEKITINNLKIDNIKINNEEVFFLGKLIDEPFTSRKTASGMLIKDKDEAKCMGVKGNTVVWNQHFNLSEDYPISYDNTEGSSIHYITLERKIPYYTNTINGHIIFANAILKNNGGDIDALNKIYFTDRNQLDIRDGIIFTANTDMTVGYIGLYSVVNIGKNCNAKITVTFFDLTQMFGSDAQICRALRVPDLTTEANKQQAIANFREMFPRDYYEYDPGRLLDTRLIGKWSGWNQILDLGVMKLSRLSSGNFYTRQSTGALTKSGHQNYLRFELCSDSNRGVASVSVNVNAPNVGNYTKPNEWVVFKGIYSSNNTMYKLIDFSLINPSTEATYCQIRNAQEIDLTQLFGAGNEPTTVAQFETWMKEHGMNPDEYQEYTTSSSLLPSRIACTMPQQGQIACVDDSNPTNIKKYLKWPSEMTATDKNNAVGVVFAVDDEKGYIVGNVNNTSKQWSCVADYEITAIPSASGSYTVTLNNVNQGTMTYTRSEGTIAEFATQLETFLRGCDASSKAAKWEAYTNPDTGKSYLQMFNYNEYESTVTVQGCTLSKLIGSELAPYTNSTIHNQIGQAMNYWCGMCRQRIEEYCTNNGSSPSTAMDGVTMLHPANNAPCRKSYYDGDLGVNLRAHYPTYGEYIDACMVKLDKNGTDIMKWWDGKFYTALLTAKNVLKQGVSTPAYPAADYCIKYDGGQPGFRAGDWWLPSFYQEGLLMKDIRGDKQDPVNKALTFLGWQTISTTSNRWSSSRYRTNTAWTYTNAGICNSDYFYNSLTVSAVSAFNISDFIYDAPADSSTSSTLFLPQAETDIILRSAGAVSDEIVGNKIIRRVGTVDMGTLTYRSSTLSTYYVDNVDYIKLNIAVNSTRYYQHSSSNWSLTPSAYVNGNPATTPDRTIGVPCLYGGYHANYFCIKYTGTTSIKTALSGVYLNYELAEPYTEPLPTGWEKHYTAYNQGTETLLPENLSYPYTSPIKLKNRYKNIETT